MRCIFRSLVLAATCVALGGTGAAQDKKTQQIFGWGEFIDPAADCKASEEKGKVTLTVPGTEHNLNPEPEYDNLLGPRLLQAVEGNFQIQVKVLAFPRPGANTSSTKQKVSYVAAGLLIWQDDKTFLRCFRAANGERSDIFVHVEAFKTAKRLQSRFFTKTVQERVIPDEAIYFRVERRGTELTIHRSPDGKDWARFASQTISGLPKKLHVGVAAVNATNKEFAPQFEELKLTSK